MANVYQFESPDITGLLQDVEACLAEAWESSAPEVEAGVESVLSARSRLVHAWAQLVGEGQALVSLSVAIAEGIDACSEALRELHREALAVDDCEYSDDVFVTGCLRTACELAERIGPPRGLDDLWECLLARRAVYLADVADFDQRLAAMAGTWRRFEAARSALNVRRGALQVALRRAPPVFVRRAA